MQFGQKFGGPFPLPQNLAAQRHQRDREYFRNATRHRQSENDAANYRESCADIVNLVYFGRQTAKNRTGSDPPNRWPSRWALPCILVVCISVCIASRVPLI